MKDLKRAFQHLQVIDIPHSRHIPAIGEEARGHILAKGQVCTAFNTNAVVIVNPAQIGEVEMPGKGSGLAADPFHHVSISGEGIDVVMKQLETRAIEVRRQPALSYRHSYAGSHSLAQRTGGRLDAGRPAIFGMTRTFALELAEVLNVLKFDR